MATLVNADNGVDNTGNFGSSSSATYSAMPFYIPAGATITGFGIKGSRGVSSTGGTFSGNIYEGGADPSAGTLKKTETFNVSLLPTYTTTPTMQQIDFTTDTGSLTGGATLYWLLIICLTGHTTDEIRWSFDATGNPYTDGYRWFDTDGASWSSNTGQDLNFAIYGTEATGATFTPKVTMF